MKFTREWQPAHDEYSITVTRRLASGRLEVCRYYNGRVYGSRAAALVDAARFRRKGRTVRVVKRHRPGDWVLTGVL